MRRAAKKAIRTRFRQEVFARDGYKCRACGKDGNRFHLDAHHIISRDIAPNGGYRADNGISLCRECHVKAEAGTISAEALKALIL